MVCTTRFRVCGSPRRFQSMESPADLLEVPLGALPVFGRTHLNYETVEPYPVTIHSGGKSLADADYWVEKMKYGKKGKDKDLTTLR